MSKPEASDASSYPPSTRSERVEVLALIRFEEREVIMPVGVANLEEDAMGRQVVVIRLALGGRIFLPLWDLLILAGQDPRDLARTPS